MSFHKFTLIRAKTGAVGCKDRRGHWNPIKAANILRKIGCDGDIEVTHSVYDESGNGRSGHDGRYLVTPDDTVTRLARFSEFGTEHV